MVVAVIVEIIVTQPTSVTDHVTRKLLDVATADLIHQTG